jgi:selenide,water dikinase
MHAHTQVSQVTASGVHFNGGEFLPLQQTFMCTPAAAPSWPEAAGLNTERGFIAVNQQLQSTSHPNVFAAGDVAEMVGDPRPKAGVYAVRQAPTLAHNLVAWCTGAPLRTLNLQRQFLSLLSLGEQRATGGRQGITVSGHWVWRWKDRIDRQFMQTLTELPAAMAMPTESTSEPMPCAGCGSKLGPAQLSGALSGLQHWSRPNIKAALMPAEDASLWQPRAGFDVVQSVDGFRAFSSDLYRFGQVCVLHALSDLWAMNAEPVAAHVWANIGFAVPHLQGNDLGQLMAGISDALVQHECVLAGGHSSAGMETHVGITAHGEVAPDAVWRTSGAQPGDALVFSKALGTGVIWAADMQGAAAAATVEAAWAHMLQANAQARTQLQPVNPHAVVDVTGFGLLGHCMAMMRSANTQAQLDISQIPAIPGALDLLAAGWQSSLAPQLAALWLDCSGADVLTEAQRGLLIDPQTSGGLLAAIAPEQPIPPGFVQIGVVQPKSATAAWIDFVDPGV